MSKFQGKRRHRIACFLSLTSYLAAATL